MAVIELFGVTWRFMVQLSGLCLHEHRYREYRGPEGAEEPAYVCESCGHAVPVIARPDGWVRTQPVAMKARAVAGKVTPMRRAAR